MATRKERLLEQVVVASDQNELILLREKLETITEYDTTPVEEDSITPQG